MKSRNQAHIFAAEESYFKPPKTKSSQNNNSVDEDDRPLNQAIEDFKLRVKVEGRAEKTMDQYDYVLGRLVKKLSQDKEVNDIETKELRKYLAYLMDDGLNNTSVAIHYRVLRAFFNWLEQENYIGKSPVNDIQEPKTPDKYPKILDQE